MSNILAKYKKVYMVGIKGGWHDHARSVLKEKGCDISGSDIPDTFLTDKVLKERKRKWKASIVKNLFS